MPQYISLSKGEFCGGKQPLNKRGLLEKGQKVHREEIEQRFSWAGWELDGAFSGYLVIGYSDDNLSILAHKAAWQTENPVFVLLDHERNLTYEVQEIPTPQQAAELLHEHGNLAEEWDEQP